MISSQATHGAVMALAILLLIPAYASADAGLYKERCAKCHARAGALANGLKGQTKEDKAAALDTASRTMSRSRGSALGADAIKYGWS